MINSIKLRGLFIGRSSVWMLHFEPNHKALGKGHPQKFGSVSLALDHTHNKSYLIHN